MSSKKGDEYPLRFWLLSSLKALTELDCDEGEYLLELAFENEVVILKFSSSSDLKRWLILLKKAKDFQPSTYFSGESVSDVKDTLLALDASTVIAFSLDEDGKIVRHDLLIISNIVDIKLKISKPECSLVRLFLIKKDWPTSKRRTLSFRSYKETFHKYYGGWCSKITALVESLHNTSRGCGEATDIIVKIS